MDNASSHRNKIKDLVNKYNEIYIQFLINILQMR